MVICGKKDGELIGAFATRYTGHRLPLELRFGMWSHVEYRFRTYSPNKNVRPRTVSARVQSLEIAGILKRGRSSFDDFDFRIWPGTVVEYCVQR